MATYLPFLLLITAASAQQSVWGQCGGIGWSGSTTCVSSAYCDQLNPYYYQCLPGTASTTSPPTTRSTTTTTTTTTTTKTTSTTTTRTTTRPASSSKSSSSPPTSSRSSAITTTTTAKPSTTPTGTGSNAFPTTNGLYFTIDGVTDYFAGTNCYWCSFLGNATLLDTILGHIQTSGLKILRVWGFNDVNALPASGQPYFQYLQAGNSSINTGADGLQLLDLVVTAAEAHGLKLIINFVNNWNDYGGIAAYSAAFGCNATTWFTNTAAQAQYRAYIAAVVSRYASSNAIFAWELANEPRCHGCDPSVIYNWASSTSAYVKSLDKYHMVTLGDEGFGLPGNTTYPYTTEEGLDFATNLGISTLDFGTFHLYPEGYGSTSNHCADEAPWQETAIESPGIAADSFWQWGDQLTWSESPDDSYTIYYGSSDYTCLVVNHMAGINALPARRRAAWELWDTLTS